jgi:hypothetical protein
LFRFGVHASNDAEISGENAIDILTKSRVYGLDRLFNIVETVVGYSIDVENVSCVYEVSDISLSLSLYLSISLLLCLHISSLLI